MEGFLGKPSPEALHWGFPLVFGSAPRAGALWQLAALWRCVSIVGVQFWHEHHLVVDVTRSGHPEKADLQSPV